MPAHFPAPTPATDRSRLSRPVLAAAFALLLAAVVALQLSGIALGETKSEQLSDVRDRQEAISSQLAASEGAVTELMGQVADLREAEAAANEELSAREAELEEATAELKDGRDKLEQLRKEYAIAGHELEGMLVDIYKSPTPDLGTVLLNSSDIEDYETAKQYYDRLQDYQSDVIERARTLKEEMTTTVEGLADTRARAEKARDEIQARRDEIASQRASLEQREADLRAARAAHEAMLADLRSREGSLEDAIQRQAARDAAAAAAATTTPDTSTGGPAPVEPAPAPVPGDTASIASDGSAIPPEGAPPQVVAAIQAANAIKDLPYVWGGGHGSFESSGYDCSGAVSYMLHGGGFLDTPLDSTGLASWGEEGPGSWITVYANSGHAYAVVAGLRWDTSGTGGSGPGWSTSLDGYLDPSAYTVRHPSGF